MTTDDHRCSEPMGATAGSLAPTTLLREETRGTTRPLAARPRISTIVRSSPSSLNWGPAPASFPAGARMAVLQGNPSARELYIAFLRFPDGYELPPHTHATDEHLMVITGVLHVGSGGTADDAASRQLCSGGATTVRAGEPHYARAQGVTIVQINAIGPLVNNWIAPTEERTSRTA